MGKSIGITETVKASFDQYQEALGAPNASVALEALLALAAEKKAMEELDQVEAAGVAEVDKHLARVRRDLVGVLLHQSVEAHEAQDEHQKALNERDEQIAALGEEVEKLRDEVERLKPFEAEAVALRAKVAEQTDTAVLLTKVMEVVSHLEVPTVKAVPGVVVQEQ